MECPECGLLNPDTAERCDCGYSFTAQEIPVEYIDESVPPTVLIVIWGLVELLGVSAFLAGFFLDITWLMVAGGCLSVLDDIVQIALGVLNPGLPIVAGVALAYIFTPWYVGVFWSSAGLKVMNIPTALMKIFTPHSVFPRN